MSAALQAMDVTPRPLGEYARTAGPEAVEGVRAAAAPLRDARVLHLSAAGAGGSVPELLAAALPLAADVGLRPEWRVLFGDPDLQRVASGLQHGLQGAETAIDDEAWEHYVSACAQLVEPLAGEYDVVVLHDGGALGALPVLAQLATPVIWSCHVDASRPDRLLAERVAGLLDAATAVVVPAPDLAPPGVGELRPVAPGIDPLSPRNAELDPRLAGRALRQLGADLTRPLCCHVMRFDRWKDPHATLEVFALARQDLRGFQLVIAGALESQDPGGWQAVKEITDYAADEPDLLLLTSYAGLGNLELGALHQLARVSLRLSLNEGFGLATAEALWRGTPVIGSAGGGLPIQVRDGVDGYLTSGVEDTAERLVQLVRDPGLAIEMGKAGRERVRERFLVTRALQDELGVLASVLGAGTVGAG